MTSPARFAPAQIAIAITTRAAQSMGDYAEELHSEAIEMAEAYAEAARIENHRHAYGSKAIASEEVEAELLAAFEADQADYFAWRDEREEERNMNLCPDGCMCGATPFTLTLYMGDPTFSMVTFP
jgi:hypothetical protein